ncbi:MAG: hypothetical protein OXG02_05430 [Chloroflexi bacterium]|nr:hypothetical protein [Chloroflexota bacterium]MCY4106128.1 hypothetical protein [Chloroflexota bacterium]
MSVLYRVLNTKKSLVIIATFILFSVGMTHAGFLYTAFQDLSTRDRLAMAGSINNMIYEALYETLDVEYGEVTGGEIYKSFGPTLVMGLCLANDGDPIICSNEYNLFLEELETWGEEEAYIFMATHIAAFIESKDESIED